jgi:ubiquitin C-terminal hydrolase
MLNNQKQTDCREFLRHLLKKLTESGSDRIQQYK